MKPDRQLARYLSRLGYGTRRELENAIAQGRVTGEGASLAFDGVLVDPGPPLVLMLHKPRGYTCSHKDQGPLVYDLLPPRFSRRDPALNSVGRLDQDSSGLLLFTDDGALLHRLTSPKYAHEKEYEAELARELKGNEGAIFASGTLMLIDEDTPLRPAKFDATGKRSVRLVLTEGRYHQVRRMFAAVGNHVERLHRSRFGAIVLGDLPEGQWRILTADERAALEPKKEA
jgi:16S rRNA pseudouridine516 synthase